MVGKTREEALVTRNTILDAAETVFQEHGVGRASLAEIAAAAGVTRGAVYWHFANKIELFDAMMQRVFDAMKAKLDELQKQRHYDDPVEAMREMALYFLGRVVSDPSYRRIVEIFWHKCEYIGELTEIRDRHFEHRRNFLDASVAAFRAAGELGFLTPRANPYTAAVGMLSVVDGLVVNWTLDPSAFPLVETGTEIIGNYLSGLRSSKNETADPEKRLVSDT